MLGQGDDWGSGWISIGKYKITGRFLSTSWKYIRNNGFHLGLCFFREKYPFYPITRDPFSYPPDEVARWIRMHLIFCEVTVIIRWFSGPYAKLYRHIKKMGYV